LSELVFHRFRRTINCNYLDEYHVISGILKSDYLWSFNESTFEWTFVWSQPVPVSCSVFFIRDYLKLKIKIYARGDESRRKSFNNFCDFVKKQCR
jgi:hypothetical protein